MNTNKMIKTIMMMIGVKHVSNEGTWGIPFDPDELVELPDD
jgi:hypothetical protein